MLVTRSYAILLEGADRLSLKVLLSRFIITDKYFSLDTLNTAINNCSYSSTDELDKPRMVEKGDILPSGSLSQSAASMRVLMYGLPFLIGEFVPEGNEHRLISLSFCRLIFFVSHHMLRTAQFAHCGRLLLLTTKILLLSTLELVSSQSCIM